MPRTFSRLTLFFALLLLVTTGLVIGQSGPGNPRVATSQVSLGDTRREPGALRIATYNVEHFNRMFDQAAMPPRSRDMTEYFRDDEDLYEVARTIGLASFDADIIGIQECTSQKWLEQFNKEYLRGRYEYVKVFNTNVEGQWLGLLAKPGFKALDVREFHKDVDPVREPALRRAKEQAGIWEKNLLFSRGPSFVLLQTPSGQKLWVGVTHVKSKYGNSEAVTKWRIRELQRTREIAGELIAEGATDMLVLLGDFNDDFGLDYHEKAIGEDAIATMLAGKGSESLTCLTRPLVQADPKLSTYHCQIKPPQYRSFIDHIFASPALAKTARRTWVVTDPIAAVASDHYPVVTELRIPARR